MSNSEQSFDHSTADKSRMAPDRAASSIWKLECGCSGTVNPNEILKTCEKHVHRKGGSFTGDQPPKSLDWPAPRPTDRSAQHESYYVLSEAERAKGFVRPVRSSYVHTVCGTTTTMGSALAETYARDPHYYGATFCVNCGSHYPVGEDGEFVWSGTAEKVGT
jgi:hypothetical protein